MDFPRLLDLAGLEHRVLCTEDDRLHPLRGRSWKSFLDAISNDGVTKGKFINAHPLYDQVTGWELAGSVL